MSWTSFQRHVKSKHLRFYGTCLFGKRNWKERVQNNTLLQVNAKKKAEMIRGFSNSNEDSKLPALHEDCYPTPGIFAIYKNTFRIQWDIKNKLDSSFDPSEFLEGALRAQKVVSNALAQDDYDALNDLVDAKALEDIKPVLNRLTPEQKSRIAIGDKELTFPTIYDINIRKEPGNINVVEILVVTKYLKGLDIDSISQLNFIEQMKKCTEETYVCNYNFVRKYKEDIASDWGINFVNHYHFTVKLGL